MFLVERQPSEICMHRPEPVAGRADRCPMPSGVPQSGEVLKLAGEIAVVHAFGYYKEAVARTWLHGVLLKLLNSWFPSPIPVDIRTPMTLDHLLSHV